MALFEIRNLTFTYPDQEKPALTDLNFSLKQGEFLVVCGKSGCGKSTLLRHFKTAMAPYGERKGQILFEGRELDAVSVREMSGDTERLRDVIEKTEIRHLLGSHPYDLSGGEQQRAALAKVLLLDPEIILLDEPTKGLDGFYKKKLAQILKGLTAEGKTILMVSHDIEFCAEHGDTCALFFHGSVVTSAPAREFFAGNSFYTTAANRMARKWYPDAVTAKDVIERCRE